MVGMLLAEVVLAPNSFRKSPSILPSSSTTVCSCCCLQEVIVTYVFSTDDEQHAGVEAGS